MKYITTLICSVVLNSLCHAQASISNEKQNIVYIGVDNLMKVGVYNFDCKDIDLKVDKGEIKKAKTECGEYIYTATEPGVVKFSILGLTNNSVVAVDNIVYRIKYPPNPKAQVHITLPGKNPDTGEDCCNGMTVQAEKHVSVPQIKAAIGLGTFLNDFDYAVSYRIESFSYSINRANKIIISGNNNGNKGDQNFINNMNLLLSGDTLSFYNIFCAATFKEHIPLESFEIYID